VRQRGTNGSAAGGRTDNLGNFHILGVPAGPLEIDVSHAGFASQTVRITIKGRAPAPLRIELQLAGVHQAVTVSDSAAKVNTDSSENLDTVTMDRQMMDNLPVFDQNYVAAMSQFLDAGSIGTNSVTLVVNGMEQRNIGVTASANPAGEDQSESVFRRVRASRGGAYRGHHQAGVPDLPWHL
jgi:Carboxypeptidase regulatory-like domain